MYEPTHDRLLPENSADHAGQCPPTHDKTSNHDSLSHMLSNSQMAQFCKRDLEVEIVTNDAAKSPNLCCGEQCTAATHVPPVLPRWNNIDFFSTTGVEMQRWKTLSTKGTSARPRPTCAISNQAIPKWIVYLMSRLYESGRVNWFPAGRSSLY